MSITVNEVNHKTEAPVYLFFRSVSLACFIAKLEELIDLTSMCMICTLIKTKAAYVYANEQFWVYAFIMFWSVQFYSVGLRVHL